MTKADLIAKISEETGLERNEVSRAVESMMEFIKSSLTNGQNVYLRGFGSFVVREQSQRYRILCIAVLEEVDFIWGLWGRVGELRELSIRMQ